MTAEIVDHALSYAARGWPVFPCQGKKPLTPHGFKDATTNPNAIERAWVRDRRANVALATGVQAKVWVLDVDGAEGSRSLTALEAKLGPLPVTLEVSTPGGPGRHLYFAWPPGREIRNRANLGADVLGKEKTGLDVRGEGGYVMLPPSIHPSGVAYAWSTTDDEPVAYAPKEWLDLVNPLPKVVAPWERLDPPPPLRRPPPTEYRTPVVERARLYLAECDPAVQGGGGHNALLWAARSLVVGFELDDDTAISLLWSDYNPRCVPPWNPDDESERRDFERKASQARTTPSSKRPGWLLDEYGLRTGAEAMAAVARGEEIATALLASEARRKPPAPPAPAPAPPPERGKGPRAEFPIGLFPKPIRDLIVMVSDAHDVDRSCVALPVLVVAGCAMGNAWRLMLKESWKVPPTLWGAIVAGSSTNKTGPLDEIVEPLHELPHPDSILDPMLNPQARMVVGNATLEAVVARMQESKRGLLCFNDELAAWSQAFDKGQGRKKGGSGDEQAWIQFWNARKYYLDRKTNNEQIEIHAAACSVLGGIQPKIFGSCFDPDRFASGLVPRLLIAAPSRRRKRWRDEIVTEDAKEEWLRIVTWLRCTPFKSIDTNRGRFEPRTVRLDPHAQAAFEASVNALGDESDDETDDNLLALYGKTDGQAGRLVLVHHGLRLACGDRDLDAPVTLESVEAGVAWSRWFLDEQLRVYGYAGTVMQEENAEELVTLIRAKFPTGVTPRQLQHHNNKKWPTARVARTSLDRAVGLGHGRWEDEHKKNRFFLTEGAKK